MEVSEEGKDKTFEMYKQIFKGSIEKDEAADKAAAKKEEKIKIKSDSFSEGENSFGLPGGEDAEGDEHED